MLALGPSLLGATDKERTAASRFWGRIEIGCCRAVHDKLKICLASKQRPEETRRVRGRDGRRGCTCDRCVTPPMTAVPEPDCIAACTLSNLLGRQEADCGRRALSDGPEAGLPTLTARAPFAAINRSAVFDSWTWRGADRKFVMYECCSSPAARSPFLGELCSFSLLFSHACRSSTASHIRPQPHDPNHDVMLSSHLEY